MKKGPLVGEQRDRLEREVAKLQRAVEWLRLAMRVQLGACTGRQQAPAKGLRVRSRCFVAASLYCWFWVCSFVLGFEQNALSVSAAALSTSAISMR